MKDIDDLDKSKPISRGNSHSQISGGTTMPLTIVKTELLDNIQNGYNQFETLIAPLSNEEMTVAKVNDSWTIQDNIAHLTVWQDYLLSQLEGVIDGKQPPEFMPGLYRGRGKRKHLPAKQRSTTVRSVSRLSPLLSTRAGSRQDSK
jgi:hypothetical protein